MKGESSSVLRIHIYLVLELIDKIGSTLFELPKDLLVSHLITV